MKLQYKYHNDNIDNFCNAMSNARDQLLPLAGYSKFCFLFPATVLYLCCLFLFLNVTQKYIFKLCFTICQDITCVM